MDQDRTIAQAWGQTGWAGYNGVSRTLAGVMAQGTENILNVLVRICKPFIDKEAVLELK